MSILSVGARHLHIPVLCVTPVLHGFLVLEDTTGLTTFSADRERRLTNGGLTGATRELTRI